MNQNEVFVPQIEVFSSDHYFIFLHNNESLWWHKTIGSFQTKTGLDVRSLANIRCIGICHGIIGRLQLPGVVELRLLVVRCVQHVGQGIFKIQGISFLHTDAQPTLRTCDRHQTSLQVGTSQQKTTFAKTLGVVKAASNTIKSSTQQAASKIISRDNKIERRLLDELNKIFNDTDSFYFSTTRDLTNSLQRQFSNDSKIVPVWKNVDDRFFWNKHMLQDIIDIGSPACDPWVIPIIQGFIQIETCKIDAGLNYHDGDYLVSRFEELRLILISRRSRYRAGTRYKRRGVDEDGHCANYVETEQIVEHGHHSLSFVQVRGSVPVFWAQPGYKYRPPPTLLKGPVETQAAFNKHFAQEKIVYGPICIINLVEQSGKEKIIWDSYTNHVLALNDPHITYATFDFHEYCRGMHFENVSYLTENLHEIIRTQGYCWSDKQGIICKQTGTFRVNCIDCLDRTNVVQTAIGKVILESQLTKLGLIMPEGHMPSEMRAVFQLLWANNGDVISRQYAGTNALKGDYTRTGERKLTGLMKDGMNSANRYYRVHLRDCYRQAAIDLASGESLPERIDFLNNLTANAEDFFIETRNVLIPKQSPEMLNYTGSVALANEYELGRFIYLTMRYYLSRFKDASRQATIDIMLGHEVSEDVFSDSKVAGDDEDAAATVEHVKILLDDCKKLLINDTTEILGCWGLIDADPVTGDPSETEIDSILILTKYAYYVAEYDDQVDRVSKYQRVSLRDIKMLEVGIIGAGNAPLAMFKKQASFYCFRIHYAIDGETGYLHTFRSTNLRFFNNVAVYINTTEEMIESLRAISEAFTIALDVAGLPSVPSKMGDSLEKVKSKVVKTDCICRLGSYLDVGSSHGMSRNTSETQLIALKTAGTKALTNISQQFSKMGRLGQSLRRAQTKVTVKNPPVFSVEGPQEELAEEAREINDNSSHTSLSPEIAKSFSIDWYLPSIGVVMGNKPKNSSIMEEILKNSVEDKNRARSPFSHARTQVEFDAETLKESWKRTIDMKVAAPPSARKLVKSSEVIVPNKVDHIQVPKLLNLNFPQRSSSEKDLTFTMASSQSENALKSLKLNLVSVISSPSSAKEMLSPLSKLARGVQAFDIRKLRTDSGFRVTEAHLEDVKKLEERWAGCNSKLIAL